MLGGGEGDACESWRSGGVNEGYGAKRKGRHHDIRRGYSDYNT